MTKTKSQKGFTLIELMIVVAIIGILAAIAIPNFIRYQLRSKTTEAKTVIGGIKTSEEAFRAEYDTYVGSVTRPAAGIRNIKQPWDFGGARICANTCNRVSISVMGGGTGLCTQYECIGYRPSGSVYYEYATVVVDPGVAPAIPPEFATGAVADLDGDATQGGFLYGTGNGPTAVGGMTSPALGNPNGVGAFGSMVCAAGTSPASEVIDCNPQAF